MAFISLIGVFCCSALFTHQAHSEEDPYFVLKLNLEPESDMNESLIQNNKVDVLQNIDPEYANKKQKENHEYMLKHKPHGIFKMIKETVIWVWRTLTWSPYGLMLLLRGYIIVFSLRYNTLWSIILIFWNYYSIFYTNVYWFLVLTPW